MKAITCLFLLACACSAFAEDPVKTLHSISDFAFGGVGYAGTTSQGELAFREALRQPRATETFLRLLDSGSPAAKCYSLVALRGIAPDVYRAKVGKFEKDKTKVSTIGGCMIMVVPMSSVVANIEAGYFDSYVKKDK